MHRHTDDANENNYDYDLSDKIECAVALRRYTMCTLYVCTYVCMFAHAYVYIYISFLF